MKDKKTNKWLFPTGIAFLFIAFVMLLISLLTGHTTITGSFESQNKVETAICESAKTAYSLFAFDGSDNKSLRISAIFNNDALSSISLIYKLEYHDEESLYYSEARNHSEMNQNFSNDGMKPDSLTAKYSVVSSGLQFSIFARGEEIGNKTLKYFMLDENTNISDSTVKEVTNHYNKLGLNCTIKNNNKEEEKE